MSITFGLAVYLIIWWLTLFMVLPWGVQTVADPNPGDDHGAPDKPRMVIKAAVTTVIAGIFFAIFYFVYEAGLISFR